MALVVFKCSSKCTMHRTFLLSLFFVTAALANNDEEDFNKCSQLINPGASTCCKSEQFKMNIGSRNLNECYQLPHSLASCDRDICIANKLGIASPSGKIYKNGLRNYIVEIYLNNDTETIEVVLSQCTDEHLNKYGPRDICELKKLKLCIHLRLIAHCNKWDNNLPCIKVKQLTNECMQLYM